jgi:dinuclear metal center YbgI/SA1388 family protein
MKGMIAMPTVAAVLGFLEQFAPPSLAAEWDNVGLLLGDRQARVKRMMTCLTVTPESAAEAVEAKAQLIVTHHPILFRPVKRLTTGNPEGRMILSLVRAGVAVYSPHTAFDNTRGGINDAIARRLGLTDVGPLRRGEGPRKCKVVVFVPDKDLSRVSDALFAAGAGRIGDYSECSFRLSGTGTFFGSDASNPTVGRKGRREDVSEWRLEVVCPESAVEAVVTAMRKAHSYEEPAFDIYPLRPAAGVGEGRVGRLSKPVLLAEFAKSVKSALGAALVQSVGDPTKSVGRVAIVCGAGGEFLHDAIRARADVLLTGEMRFHDYLSAQAQELALVLPGHYATERFGIEELAERLQEQWKDVEVWASRRESDPVRWA